jgi:16S rRNA (guanine966-N2)-methyltransferase
MRIVGGSLKGRPIATPAGRETRPTSDRARQAVFNILVHGEDTPQDQMVLDAFAGSGALGLEALSRGARFATFLEIAGPAVQTIRTNVTNFKLQEKAEILRVDAASPPIRRGEPADLVFLDPPYGLRLLEASLTFLAARGWLAPGALCVAEVGATEHFTKPAGFTIEDERRYGAARILFLRRDA